MYKNKKALMDVKELISTLVVAAILGIVGVVIFSNVSNSSNTIFANDKKNAENESVTISVTNSGLGDNSTLLAQSGYITDSETVINDSSGRALVRNVDYKITLQGGTSGELETRANFTLLNATMNCRTETCYSSAGNVSGFNNTALDISYNYNTKSGGRLVKEKVDTTTLDSFELAVVGLIVLAAVVIVSTVYMIGTQ